jgi:hypothetical protein
MRKGADTIKKVLVFTGIGFTGGVLLLNLTLWLVIIFVLPRSATPACLLCLLPLLLILSLWWSQTRSSDPWHEDNARSQRRRYRWTLYLQKIRTDWANANRRVHLKPIPAFFHGDAWQIVYSDARFGALGIVDEQVSFVPQDYGVEGHDLPFASIRGVVTGSITIRTGSSLSTPESAVLIHVETPGGWRVYVYSIDFKVLHHVVQHLRDVAGVPISYRDLGQVHAPRWRQDIYGQWHADRKVTLYLAPDRLLCDWRDAILLAQVRGVAVVARVGLNLANAALLRIEYSDSPPQTIGFEMPFSRAEEWGRALAEQAGRKKKEV